MIHWVSSSATTTAKQARLRKAKVRYTLKYGEKVLYTATDDNCMVICKVCKQRWLEFWLRYFSVRGKISTILSLVSINYHGSLFFTRTWLRYVRVFGVAIPYVCLSSVTFVHPTQPVEIFHNLSTPFCSLAIHWPPCRIHADRPRGTPPSGVKRERGSQI